MSVYTELSREEVEAILAGYDLGALRGYEGIAAGIENSNFFVDTERGRFVLTIFERMNDDELIYFMHLMQHISEKGVPAPAVQRRRDGTLLFDVRGKKGCVITRLPGTVHERLGAARLASAGATLARLHEAGADFELRRANPTGLGWLRRTADEVVEGAASRYGRDAADLLRDELAWQADHPAPPLPRGVIHADYFVDNILFEGDRVSGVIDFYYAHDAPYAMDLAIAINALAVELGEDDEARVDAFVGGYEGVRPLAPAERAALPGLLRLAALRFWVSRLFDAIFPRAGAMVQIKDPEEYRRKLLVHRRA